MSAGSTFNDFVLALVSTIDTALPTVMVFDGPSVDQGTYNDWCTVGWTDDPEDEEAGMFDQNWRTDAGTSARRDETLTVRCALISYTGDGAVAARRAVVFTHLAAIGAALRAGGALGVDQLMWAQLASGRVYQDFVEGPRVEIRFTVTAQALT